MATPLGMNAASTLASDGSTALQRKGWLMSKIYMESVKADVYMGNANLIEPLVVKSTKDTMKVNTSKSIIKISAGDKGLDDGMDEVTLAMSQALQDDAVNGNATPYIGAEETRRWKFHTTAANDFGRPLASFGFGIDKLSQDWVMKPEDRRLLSQWLGETKGLHVRQTYCETISENLEAAPISRVAGLNPNITFAEDLTSGTDVVDGIVKYDPTFATYEASLVAGGLATTDANNHTTVNQILRLADVAAQSFYIKPIMVDGNEMYKYIMAPEEIRLLRDSQNTGSYAKDYIAGSALARVKEIVPEADMVIGDIIICKDDRNPTLQIDAAAIEFGYQLQGRRSSRHAPASDVDTRTFNVNVLCGAESIVEYTREGVDFRTQDDDYGRNKGELIRECSGMTLPIFDKDTKTSTSVQYEGGLLVLTARESNIGESRF